MSKLKSSDLHPEVVVEINQQEGRKQRIFAKISIPYSSEQVWQVITNYESFAGFIPNMAESRRLQHPSGGIRLEQIRIKSLMGMKVSARSVVDIQERFPHEVHYQLVEGDFREFSGVWRLVEKENSEFKTGVELIYDFSVLPKSIIPAPVFSHFLKNDIPAILVAVRQQVAKSSR